MRKYIKITLKTKNEIEQSTIKKTQLQEKELHVEYSKAKRKSLKRCFIRIMGKIINAAEMTPENKDRFCKIPYLDNANTETRRRHNPRQPK